MRTGFIEEVKSSIKNWWLSLIAGILFTGFGIFMLFNPASSYVALAIMFSVCVFTSGIFEIAFSITNREELNGWGWYLAGGIIDLFIGILLITNPGISGVMIPFLLSFWIMFRGFSAIGFGFDLQRYGSKNWGWYIVFGILAILCSIAIIFWPATGAVTSVFIVAFAFIFIGVFRMMLSFELKRLKDNNEKVREKVKEFYQMLNDNK